MASAKRLHSPSLAPGARSSWRRVNRRGEALAVATDVTDAVQVDALVEKTFAAFGRLDIMVNNAGGAVVVGPPDTITPKMWRLIIGLNLNSVFFGSIAAARVMKKQGGGRIINISSKAGVSGPFQANMAGYGAAKAGVNNLSEALASAWAKDNISVNSVTPGAIATPGMKSMGRIPKATKPDGTKKSPLTLAPEAERVADLVLFLSSPAAAGVSGEVIGISADYHLDTR